MRWLITPSLLNAWRYFIESDYGDRTDWERTLRREPSPTTEAQQFGMDYETATWQGLTEASPYIEGSQYQIAQSLPLEVLGAEFLLYGRIDFLKAGEIIDLKTTRKYERPKFRNNFQTGAYLALFPEAVKMTYLVWDRVAEHLFTESYFRDEVDPIECDIGDFWRWLGASGYRPTFEAHWASRDEQTSHNN